MLAITIGFILLAVLSPLCVIAAYRQGVKDRAAISRGEAPAPIVRLPKRTPPRSALDERYDAILRNIDVFDGTENRQREVRK